MQERVIPNEWNTLELYYLASSVSKFGENNWSNISNVLEARFSNSERPTDMFNPDACQSQYKSLTEKYVKMEICCEQPVRQILMNLKAVAKEEAGKIHEQEKKLLECKKKLEKLLTNENEVETPIVMKTPVKQNKVDENTPLSTSPLLSSLLNNPPVNQYRSALTTSISKFSPVVTSRSQIETSELTTTSSNNSSIVASNSENNQSPVKSSARRLNFQSKTEDTSSDGDLTTNANETNLEEANVAIITAQDDGCFIEGLSPEILQVLTDNGLLFDAVFHQLDVSESTGEKVGDQSMSVSQQEEVAATPSSMSNVGHETSSSTTNVSTTPVVSEIDVSVSQKTVDAVANNGETLATDEPNPPLNSAAATEKNDNSVCENEEDYKSDSNYAVKSVTSAESPLPNVESIATEQEQEPIINIKRVELQVKQEEREEQKVTKNREIMEVDAAEFIKNSDQQFVDEARRFVANDLTPSKTKTYSKKANTASPNPNSLLPRDGVDDGAENETVDQIVKSESVEPDDLPKNTNKVDAAKSQPPEKRRQNEAKEEEAAEKAAATTKECDLKAAGNSKAIVTENDSTKSPSPIQLAADDKVEAPLEKSASPKPPSVAKTTPAIDDVAKSTLTTTTTTTTTSNSDSIRNRVIVEDGVNPETPVESTEPASEEINANINREMTTEGLDAFTVADDNRKKNRAAKVVKRSTHEFLSPSKPAPTKVNSRSADGRNSDVVESNTIEGDSSGGKDDGEDAGGEEGNTSSTTAATDDANRESSSTSSSPLREKSEEISLKIEPSDEEPEKNDVEKNISRDISKNTASVDEGSLLLPPKTESTPPMLATPSSKKYPPPTPKSCRKNNSRNVKNSSDDTSKHQDIVRKTLNFLFTNLNSHKYCCDFQKPITNRVVPGYEDVVYKPMDLQTIKKMVDQKDRPISMMEFQRDVLLMINNAKMFNAAYSQIYDKACELQKDALLNFNLTVNTLGEGIRLPVEAESDERARKRVSAFEIKREPKPSSTKRSRYSQRDDSSSSSKRLKLGEEERV